MNDTSGFQEVRSSASRHHSIAPYTSNDIDLEQVLRSFSSLTISSFSSQALAQSKKRPLTAFSYSKTLQKSSRSTEWHDEKS